MKLIEKQDLDVEIEGHVLKLTNLNKVWWPKEKYTKGNVLEYYKKIAPYILPYLKNRPLVMHRFPNGIDQEGFFQKDVDHKVPDWIETVEIQHESKKLHYIVVQNLATLLYVINLGSFELHTFHSQIVDEHFPDYLILDLDPEKVAFEEVVKTAQFIHEYLLKFKIKSLCKTSGGRGLHIYIPLGKKYDDEQVHAFAHLIALQVQEQLPDLISLERKPANRQKRIYMDYLRNSFGQTVVTPYTLRPRPHAPVSTPLKWTEVEAGLDPLAFTIETVPTRLKKVGDLFKPILEDFNPKGLDILLSCSHGKFKA